MQYVSDFIKSYIPSTANSSLYNRVDASSPIVVSELKKTLLKWKSSMTQSGCYVDQLVCAATVTPSFTPLETYSDIVWEKEDIEERLIEISYDEYYDLIDSVKIINNQTGKKGITVTNDKGYAFQICVSEFNGYESLSTVTSPADTRDLIAFHGGDGRFFFNQYLRSIGFWRASEARSDEIDSIMDGVLHITDMLDLPAFDDFKDFTSQLAVKLGLTLSSDDLYDRFSQLASYYSITGSTIFSLVSQMYQTIFESIQFSDYGVVTTWNSIMNSLISSSTINEIYGVAIDLLVGGRFSIEGFSASTEKYKNRYSSVINNIISIYAAGGPIQVMAYLIDVLRTSSSNMHASSDGKLEWGNDNVAIPAEYIAGLVCTIVGGVVAVAGVIVAIFVPIVGALISVIGAAVMAIPKAISYDYTVNTNGTISEASCLLAAGNLEQAPEQSDVLTLPVAPFALFQYEESTTNWPYEIRKMVFDNNRVVSVSIPGGMLFVGKGNSGEFMRCEFHPFCYVYDDWGKVANWFKNTGEEKEGPSAYSWLIQCSRSSLTMENIEAAWEALMVNKRLPRVDSSLAFSDDEDELVRHCLLINNALAQLWTFAHRKGEELEDLYPDEFFYRSGGNIVPGGQDRGLATDYLWSNPLCVLSMYPDCEWYIDVSWANLAKACLNKSFNEEIYIYGYSTDLIDDEWVFDQDDLDNPDVGDWWSFGYGVYTDILKYPSLWIDDAMPLPSRWSDALGIPKYNKSTFWTYVVLSSIAVAAVTAITVVATIKIRKWRFKKRAQLSAQVANDWDEYQYAMKEYDAQDPEDDPSYHTADARQQAYKQYYQDVRRNNRWSALIGGSKYSLAGYWDTDSTSESSSSTSTLLNPDFMSYIYTGSEEQMLDPNSDDSYTANLIYNLISGKTLS